MSLFVSIVLSLLAGFAVPLQAGTNAKLGVLLGHPLWATAVSLVVSCIAVMVVMLIFKVPRPNIAVLQAGPWWIWFGGIAGVLYITAALILVPRLGTLNFIMAVIIGQLTISIMIDYFGLVGLPKQPLNLQKIIGVSVVLAGFLIAVRS
ncbi:hypothetical protein CJF35_22715 [Pseudomonas lundensis]|uniref:DMT family transporter n=1 Tax=Pseudomonas lundensis TaxID=86185 RepID=UPI000BA22FAD|nr:DMT family transporter [Pseudomonas lundensis]OZY34806.1 hypothetical protein CJF35_22715 [Pseudomonas lundensis]